MNIPTKNLIGVHYIDRKDISYRLFEAACNGRNSMARGRIAELLLQEIMASRFRLDSFDAITHGDGECSRSLAASISSNDYVRIADLSNAELRNKQVLIVAATENEARVTFARVLQYFPLKIVVLCFLKNAR